MEHLYWFSFENNNVGLLNQCSYAYGYNKQEVVSYLNKRFIDHKLRCIRIEDVVIDCLD